jgi:phosphoglycolate phosphatase-like HAD superfamily hydrolase
MQLAIFDVDGTLANTNPVDAQCFVRAVAEELGVDLRTAKWSDFTYVTDSGITLQIFQRHFGRAPLAEEVSRLQRRFRDLLAESAQRQPESFTAVAGAASALQRLVRDRDWTVAIATGSWQACASVKLQAAGIDIAGIPAAFADDGIAREEILAAAQARACTAHRVARFHRVVSIGDAPWDVRAARRLGLPFAGVRAHGDPAELREGGASHVLRDFTDFNLLLRTLAEAQVPAPDASGPPSTAV